MVGVPTLAEDAAPGDADDARPEKEARHSGRLLVRMPATLHDELAHAAEREGVSLNQLITGVLASAVGWRSPDGTEPAPSRNASRGTRIALVANLVVLVIAAIAAIALLVVALLDGW
jgi:hypothetical protein